MRGLVAFDLDDNNDDDAAVVVELNEEDPGFERAARGDGELLERAGRSFDTALDVIRPVAAAVVGKIDRLAQPPHEVTVEFGLRLNVSAGAVIASSQGEAHLQVTMTWTSKNSPAD